MPKENFAKIRRRSFFLLWSSCHFSQCMYMMYTWTQDTVLITEVLIIECRIEHSITSSVLSYSTYIIYIVLVIKRRKWWFHLSWFLFLFNPRKFLAVSSPSFAWDNRHLNCCPIPVSVHGCALMDGMDIQGESVQTTFVKSTKECAHVCSQTPKCDSFWCWTSDHASGGLTKSCRLMRNGKYRRAPHKTAGICQKSGSKISIWFILIIRF